MSLEFFSQYTCSEPVKDSVIHFLASETPVGLKTWRIRKCSLQAGDFADTDCIEKEIAVALISLGKVSEVRLVLLCVNGKKSVLKEMKKYPCVFFHYICL